MSSAEPEKAPARRGRPSVTTLEAIQGAALRVLDREGITGLTVRGVARELGVDGPRLYTHIQDHEQLVTLAYEAAEAELDGATWADIESITGWRDGLHTYAKGLEHQLTTHRGLLELSRRRRFFPTRGIGPALVELIATSASADGIDEQALADGFVDVTSFVVGIVDLRTRRTSEQQHDQLAHDVARIAEEHPAAGGLLARAGAQSGRDQISTLVDDVIRRIELLSS